METTSKWPTSCVNSGVAGVGDDTGVGIAEGVAVGVDDSPGVKMPILLWLSFSTQNMSLEPLGHHPKSEK